MFGGALLGAISSQRGSSSEIPDLTATSYNNTIIGGGVNQHTYSGTWTHFSGSSALYLTDGSYSNTPNDYVEFSWSGVKIDWWSEKFYHHGITDIYIDGILVDSINQYTAVPEDSQLLFSSGILTDGNHTIRLVVSGNKDVNSTNYYLVHDRFVVYSVGSVIPDTGDYYVSPSGNDNNVGTLASPFKTIQKAASLATAGKKVIVREGIYRETITPSNSGVLGSPIIFASVPGEVVEISGLEIIPNTDWTVHSGNIYKKTLALPVNGFAPGGISTNTDILANQIFRNGEMMIEARWPKGIKTQNDLWKMDATGNVNNSGWRHYSNFNGSGATTWPNITFRPTWLEDDILSSAFSNGSLVGANIVTQGWFFRDSRVINFHSGKRLQWSGNVWGDNSNDQQFRRYYYLTGQLQFLSQEREFHYQSGTLYFWQPGGGTPSGTVEYKARNWGFDLRNRSHIEIKGITFKGCEVATGNTNTANCTIDNIKASYTNHNVTHRVTKWQGYGMSQYMGLKLLGVNNVVKNSEFQWSASQSVWVGANCRVENNLFHHICYDGMWGCPVAFWGDDNVSNIKVLNNTMYTLGRGAIDNGFAFVEGQVKNTTNNEIAYNNISDFAKLNHDGGAFYSWGYQNLSGTRLHHNWIHDMISWRPPNGTLTDGIMAGIYFDMGSGATIGQNPLTVDHNIFWNLGDGYGYNSTEISDLYELPSFTYSTKQATRILNNTFWGGTKTYTTYQNTVAAIFRNNIFRLSVNNNWGSGPINIANSISNISQHSMGATNPLFVGGSLNTPQTYFQLQSGSPARNNGTAIAGINDSDTNPKDIGAYYYGQTPWIPGYVPVPYTG